MKTINFEL